MTDATQLLLPDLRILVVEDDLLLATTLRSFFKMSGAASVDTADTLYSAVELCCGTRYDAAVLDVDLPDGEVGELADLLKSQGVLIVFNSGNPLPGHIAKTNPDIAFFLKPTKPELLAAEISKNFSVS